LIALGNVIIPQSYPGSSSSSGNPANSANIDSRVRRHEYLDDWSDPDDSFAVKGTHYPAGHYDTPVLADDTGNETVHAVIVTYGFTCSNPALGALSCTPPSFVVGSTNDILQFRTGFYAQARTVNNGANPLWPDLTYPAYPPNGSFDNSGGNDSGTITIMGAVIQNVAGRLTYDDASSAASCNTGLSGCNIAGFSGVSYLYDTRLQYLWPPFPGELTGRPGTAAAPSTALSTIVPFGYASWDIMSWEELAPTDNPANNVW
jgi:hypothetical protein